MDRVLVVEDDPDVCRLLIDQLGAAGYAVEARTAAQEGFDVAMTRDVDVVVADVHMPRLSGIQLAERMARARPEVPVILVTAFGSVDTAVAAIRAGAHDFITKPVEPEVLLIAVRRAAQHHRLGGEVRRLRQTLDEASRFDEILGDSSAMRELFDRLYSMVVV